MELGVLKYEGLIIKKIKHAGFMIKGSRTVYIDPFQVENGKEKADILLITHEHYDHCSVKDAEKVVDENYSGHKFLRWFNNETDFTTRSGKKIV